MKKHFAIYFILVVLFSKDCSACFQEDFVTERSVTTFSTFYEECCCTEPGYTIYDLHWVDPNNRIIGPGIDSNVYTEEQGECLALHIPSSSKTLSGAYKCVTRYRGVDFVQTHYLDVYDPLYFFNTTASQYLVHSKDSMIHCNAKGASPPRFKWTRGKDGQDEITDVLKYQIRPGGVIIKNVTNEDAGIYKCSASVITTGEELEIDIDVKVMTEPTIKRITASPDAIVVAGEPLVIECLAEGLPDPEYNFNKILDAKPGQSERKRNTTWQQDNNTIRFDSIEPEDAGIYECYAHNFVGNSSKKIEIIVLVPPSIIGFANRTAIEGSEIPIHCNATGIPTPNVTIFYEGKSFEEEKNMYDQFINNYSLLKVDRSKEGIYICNATNEVDYEAEYMYLTVLYPPRFDQSKEIIWGWNGETINLTCEPEANPLANITWRYYRDTLALINESDINEMLTNAVKSLSTSFTINDEFAPYGLYECAARNELGEALLNIELRKGHVPSPGTNVLPLEITATSATFTIEGNYSYAGPAILGYKAEYDVAENYKVTHIHKNRTWALDRPLKLGNLKPNTTYFIRFSAINRVGTGEWGDMIQFETLEKSAPEPPIWQVDALQFSPSNVLKWKEPEDNGEPIDYYALRYCPILEEFEEFLCKEERIEGVTELQLSDLQHNVTYYFELIAHNAEGNSTAANISFVIIPVAEESMMYAPLLSGGAIIAISVVIVILCLVLLDVLLLLWRRQGIIASCCYKKNKKKPTTLNTRDKKGLLKDNGENRDDTLRRLNNGHKEFEYNKTTGIITGKHSSV